MVMQGDLYWADIADRSTSDLTSRRPCVIIQNNLLNQSRLATVVVCTLTSNLRRAAARGNVLLRAGEGNLPAASVVNVTQMYTVDKDTLETKIGSLSTRRIQEILAGVNLVIEPREPSRQEEDF